MRNMLMVALMVVATHASAKTFYGTNGNDTLYYGKEGTMGESTQWRDNVYGLGGNDILISGPGNDRVYGHDGNDILQLWDGNDRGEGGDGSDIISGMNGKDRLYGDGGDDYLFGGEGDDSLYGGNGNDRLYGNGGNDYLHGGDGWNVIVQSVDGVLSKDLPSGFVDEGSILDGGEGDDTLVFRLRQNMKIRGGPGADKFVVKGRTHKRTQTVIQDVGENATIVFENFKRSEVYVEEAEDGILLFKVDDGALQRIFMRYSSTDLIGLSTVTESRSSLASGLTLIFEDDI